MPHALTRLLGAIAIVALGAFACTTNLETKDDDYADKMAEEHKNDTPVKAAAGTDLGEEPDAELHTEEVVYATVNGAEVVGYLARPKGATGPLPGVLVIHEWWGLNDNVELMARHLAAEGYVALAVDLYGGEVATTPEAAKGLMTQAMEDFGSGVDNLHQAHAFLKEKQSATRTAVIGWCFGGGWSLKTALFLGPQLDAAVVYYGRLVTDKGELSGLEAPVLGIFGALDKGIPVAQISAFEAATQALDKDVTVKIFEGADHAFANPSGTRYKPEAAAEAWEMTTAFLEKHLTGGAPAMDETPAPAGGEAP